MIVSMIVAIDADGGMGMNNTLPWNMPADLAHFKKTTLGKPILMGRKTYESIGRPLPGRQNLIITRDRQFTADGCDVYYSIDVALQSLSAVDELFIIGGATIYQQTLSRADRLYLTRIHHTFKTDTQFPSIDEDLWKEVSIEQHQADDNNAYDYSFRVLEKV
jgi:dihydrofolate reductase